MADLSVNIAGVEWKNPVTTGSGTLDSEENMLNILTFRILARFVLKLYPPNPGSAISRRESPK